MGERSEIEWTEATWNPVTGCDKVSPGCAHCYAETVADRFWKTQYPPVLFSESDKGGPVYRPREFTDVQCHEDRLDQPLRWKRPRKVFVNSMSDLFHEDVPDAFIDRVFAMMAVTEWHTYQLLTKRADRMRDYMSGLTFARLLTWINDRATDGGPLKRETPAGGYVPTGAENLCTIARRVKERVYRFEPDKMPLRTPWPLSNVWLGVSVENQHWADARIPLLLQTPAAIRFISAEPLLGPLNIEPFLWDEDDRHDALCGLDWVIVGGESGPGARPCDLAWVRAIVAQCRAAGVAPFVKQLGANPVVNRNDEIGGGIHCFLRKGLRDKKGGDLTEFPPDLQVREFPAVAVP